MQRRDLNDVLQPVSLHLAPKQLRCLHGADAFELPASSRVIRVRYATLLSQKERLLNLAASWLPASCEYVGWFDCDFLFDNANWGRNLVSVLSQKRSPHASRPVCNRGPMVCRRNRRY